MRGITGNVCITSVSGVSNKSMKPTAGRCAARNEGKIMKDEVRARLVAHLSWLISLTHDLAGSFALSGYSVYLADSQSARFSLDRECAVRKSAIGETASEKII
jgi:hypothetical protein